MAIPPDLLTIIQQALAGQQPMGGMSTPMGGGVSAGQPQMTPVVPTPEEAQAQQRQKLLEIIGASQPIPGGEGPGPVASAFQTGLAGLANALSIRHGGGPPSYDALGALQAMRLHRERVQQENAQNQSQSSKAVAGYQLEQMDRAAAAKEASKAKQAEADAKLRQGLESDATSLGINPSGMDNRSLQAATAKEQGVRTTAKRTDEDNKRLDEARKMAAEHRVKILPSDSPDAIYAKISARPEDLKKGGAETAAQTDSAVRALADDLYRASQKPVNRPVTTTNEFGTSTRDAYTNEPTLTYEEALRQAAEAYGVSGRYKIAPATPKAGITLDSVREKLRGASTSQ